MALPKRKISKTRQSNKRSHQSYSSHSLSLCPQCHSPKLPHVVCPVCGSYQGREVYQVKKAKR